MNVIEAKNIKKSYGLTVALKNLSLTVKESSIFALLGPNGAGKTTFLKSLLNLVSIDEGSLTLNGLEVSDSASRKGVGYLPERFTFHHFYTVKGVLQFYGKMHDVDPSIAEEKIKFAMQSTGIEDLADRRLDTLSKGQTQRLGVANLLVGDNKILVFDEPFSGLDPIGIKDLKGLVLKLRDEMGKTIFINSHILSEMETICDEIAILNKGDCLTQGPIKEIIGSSSLEDYFYNIIRG